METRTLIGRTRGRVGRLATRLRPPPRRGALPRRLRLLRLLERRAGSRAVFGNRVTFLRDGGAAQDAMLEAIAGAKRSVAVEMYIWADDRVGRRFAAALRGKALEGVRVFVLVDAFGSLGAAGLMGDLAEVGVDVRWYHPLAPIVPIASLTRRDHRKLVLVDGVTGFAGGVNLAEEYAAKHRGLAAWFDTAIRVDGPGVREMTRLFLSTWGRAGEGIEGGGALIATPSDVGAAGVQVVAGRGLRGRRGLRRTFLGLIGSARERILLANAYFAPERWLRTALRRAARRGVRVDLLLSGPTDAPLVRWAGRAAYGGLLRAGVRIRELRRTVLHAKLAVFDEDVLLAGSANLDYRSFRHNLELAVNVFDVDSAREARTVLEAEWDEARPVEASTWRSRPMTERFAERLAWSLRYWL